MNGYQALFNRFAYSLKYVCISIGMYKNSAKGARYQDASPEPELFP